MGTHTGGPIKTRKKKAGGGLTLGDLEKQKKEKLEGAYTGGPIKTRRRKPEGGLHRGTIKTRKRKPGGE